MAMVCAKENQKGQGTRAPVEGGLPSTYRHWHFSVHHSNAAPCRYKSTIYFIFTLQYIWVTDERAKSPCYFARLGSESTDHRVEVSTISRRQGERNRPVDQKTFSSLRWLCWLLSSFQCMVRCQHWIPMCQREAGGCHLQRHHCTRVRHQL